MTADTILVVDDEPRYRTLLDLNLKRRGHRAVMAHDGLTGLNLLERYQPRLVLMDLDLPDMDGFEVCARIRELSSVPVIILTARGQEADKLRAFASGADDYVTKPFSADELLARIDAVLRRGLAQRNEPESETLEAGDIQIEPLVRRTTVCGRDIELTRTEFQLLHSLVANAGRVMVQEELLRRVWGPGYESDAALLHTTVARLRRKLEADPAAPRYIHTRRGIGYVLTAPTATAVPA
ncbi:MAG: response regulator transcription factor [Dehalococcoidia bacterium]